MPWRNSDELSLRRAGSRCWPILAAAPRSYDVLLPIERDTCRVLRSLANAITTATTCAAAAPPAIAPAAVRPFRRLYHRAIYRSTFGRERPNGCQHACRHSSGSSSGERRFTCHLQRRRILRLLRQDGAAFATFRRLHSCSGCGRCVHRCRLTMQLVPSALGACRAPSAPPR